jgi:hypothetical protein
MMTTVDDGPADVPVAARTRDRSSQIRSDAFERGRGRAAAKEARCRQLAAALLTPKLVERRRHDAGAAGAERVTERDRAAVDVNLVPVHAERAAGQRAVTVRIHGPMIDPSN